MSRTVVVLLAIFSAGIASIACADPPAPGQSPDATTQPGNSTAAVATTQPNDGTPAAATTPAATTADNAKVTRPAASAPDSKREALLLDQGYKPAMRNGEKVFCKRETPMGSRLPSALHCLTVDEAALIAQEGRETTERIQRDTVGCLGKASGGCGK